MYNGLRAHFLKWLHPHTQATAQPYHYYHINICTYRSEGRTNTKTLDGMRIPLAVLTQYPCHKPGHNHHNFDTQQSTGTLTKVVTPSYPGNC